MRYLWANARFRGLCLVRSSLNRSFAFEGSFEVREKMLFEQGPAAYQRKHAKGMQTPRPPLTRGHSQRDELRTGMRVGSVQGECLG